MKGLYCFWETEVYPYFSGSKVKDGPDEKGLFLVHGSTWVRPVLFLPNEAGEELWVKIQKLSSDYDEERARLRNLFVEKANQEISPLRICLP